MTTNITQLYNSTSFFDVIQFTSDATNGLFWMFIVVAIFVVLVVGLRKYGNDNAFLAASFSCLVISIFFMAAGILNILLPILFGAACGIIVFFKIYNGQ